MKLKYLDITTINKLYDSQKQYGDLYFFINGVKTQKLSIINDAKQTVYFIIYKDEDDVMRFEEIKQDLNFLHKIFIPVINSIDVDSLSSDETAAQIRQIENDRAAFESIRRLQRNFSAGATLMDAGVRTALSESLKTWKRPAYVTKRTRRVVRSDGTESIEVKYIFSGI